MQVVVEEARSRVELEAAQDLENRVFRREKGIHLPPLAAGPQSNVFRLIALDASGSEPIGTVAVVESGPECPVFRRYGAFIANRPGRVARYTRLAVLPEHRGHNLSMRLILEAHHRYVAKQMIHHTWLLFDAARASTSMLCTLLGFQPAAPLVRSEYGPCRLLVRDELSITAQRGNQRGWAYLAALEAPNPAPEIEPQSALPFGVMNEMALFLPPAA
jgi:GNAT superfamily N-acetyltransferase